MKRSITRRTVDLSGYPDLVVIYLGVRVNAIRGIKTLIGFGPKILKSVDDQPDGLWVQCLRPSGSCPRRHVFRALTIEYGRGAEDRRAALGE